MKKILLSLTAVVLFSSASFAQDSDIANDPDFKDYLKEDYLRYSNIKDIKVIKDLSVIESSKWTEQNFEVFSFALGFDNVTELKSFLYRQDKRLKNLDKKYDLTRFTTDNLELIITEQIEGLALPYGGIEYSRNRCNTKFHICMGAVIAAAAIAQAGCLVIDAETLGFAAYLCHTGAYSAQIAGEAGCIDSYQDCKDAN